MKKILISALIGSAIIICLLTVGIGASLLLQHYDFYALIPIVAIMIGGASYIVYKEKYDS